MSIMAVLKYNLQNDCYDPIMKINEMTLLESVNNNELSNLVDICKQLAIYEYILVDKNKNIEYNTARTNWDNHRTLSVSDFIKCHGGICYDYVNYEVTKVKSKFKTFFTGFVKNNQTEATHTYLLAYIDNYVYWIECSWKIHIGVYKFNSEDEAISYIVNALRRDNMEDFTVEYKPNSSLVGISINDFITKMINLPDYRYKNIKNPKCENIYKVKLDNNGNIVEEKTKSLNESFSVYNSSKDFKYNGLSKYKMVIVGEVHNNHMISIYRKLLSTYKFDYFIAEFADTDRSITREELKQKMDNCTHVSYTYDPSKPCDDQYNYWLYKIAYDFNIPLIGCNPVNKKYRNMNEEDKNRETYMLSVIKEFESKGRCLVQLGDHHLRSIPITKEFLEYCNDTIDDRGIYKNIDDLVIENSSPIWDEYNNKSNVLLLRVKSEYDNEVNFKKSLNEIALYESDDASKLDKNFKHKSGIDFDIVDIRDKKVKNNIDKVKEKYKDYFKGFAAFEKGTDNFAGFIRIWPDWILEEKYHGNLISPVEVKPKYRGYGLGQLLVEKAMEKYNANMLMVAKDNEVAINMYKKLGFSINQDKKWKNEDYYIMITNTVKMIKSTNEVTEDMSGTIGAALAPTANNLNIIKPMPSPTPYESDPDNYYLVTHPKDNKLTYSITKDPLQYSLFSVDPQEKGFYKVFKTDKGKIDKRYLTFKIKDKQKAKELYESLSELYKRNLTFTEHGLTSDKYPDFIYSSLTEGSIIKTFDQILFDNRFELVSDFDTSIKEMSDEIYKYIITGSNKSNIDILSEQVKELEGIIYE